MKKYLILGLFLANIAYADCFIATDESKVIMKEGECEKAYSPEGTFSIPLALAGFDLGILKDENNPKLKFDGSKYADYNFCKNDLTPRTWMLNCCRWYSKEIASQIGMKRLQKYVNEFQYGNMDLSGGITNAWISSSLKITPMQQIEFFKRMINRKLDVSPASYDMLKKLLYIQETPQQFKLYARYGQGNEQDKNGKILETRHVWFVGYAKIDGKRIYFANHMNNIGSDISNYHAYHNASSYAHKKLWNIIDAMSLEDVKN